MSHADPASAPARPLSAAGIPAAAATRAELVRAPFRRFLVALQIGVLALAASLSATLLAAMPAWAMIHAHPDPLTGTGVVRSLESLRDLDYQSWQVVAYREGPAAPGAPVTLRIVSYPGRVRLDHPVPLLVSAGRRLWELRDTTLSSAKLASDSRDAAAEFDLSPLLTDLSNNRPLRLELPGVFSELPVPPYVVEEWRSLPEWSESG